MGQIKTFRDAELSLWQSAVDEVVSRHDLAAQVASRFLRAGLAARPDLSNPRLAALVELGKDLEQRRITSAAFADRGVVSGLQGPAGQLATFFSQVSELVHQASGGLLAGIFDLAQFRQRLFTKFSSTDPGWIESAVEFAKYFVLARGKVPYKRHTQLSDFVIDGKLPAKARVALVADWGTGQPEAFQVLQQISNKKPDIVIHLGDIYYSGTQSEVRKAFFEPWQSILRPAETGCSMFNLCGNHDIYSGGSPYYHLLDLIGQPASYFCLRSDHWQFLAMDTGLNSQDILDTSRTHVEDTELAWHKDKIANAGGRKTILLSHHQPFSAFEKINDQPVYRDLLTKLSPELQQVSMWFWGHEHNFVVYDRFEGILGRCIGHGAIPVLYPRETPQVKFPEITFRQTALGNNGTFFNHGYAILDLDGPSGRVAYYQSSDENNPIDQDTI